MKPNALAEEPCTCEIGECAGYRTVAVNPLCRIHGDGGASDRKLQGNLEMKDGHITDYSCPACEDEPRPCNRPGCEGIVHVEEQEIEFSMGGPDTEEHRGLVEQCEGCGHSTFTDLCCDMDWTIEL